MQPKHQGTQYTSISVCVCLCFLPRLHCPTFLWLQFNCVCALSHVLCLSSSLLTHLTASPSQSFLSFASLVLLFYKTRALSFNLVSQILLQRTQNLFYFFSLSPHTTFSFFTGHFICYLSVGTGWQTDGAFDFELNQTGPSW